MNEASARIWAASALLVLTSMLPAGAEPVVVRHSSNAIEQFRANIPKARNLIEMNGFSVKDIDGHEYTLTSLDAAADRIAVHSQAEAEALLFYLEDKDPKIRYIAASALDRRLKANADGMSMAEILKSGTDGHRKLIERFRRKIKSAFAKPRQH